MRPGKRVEIPTEKYADTCVVMSSNTKRKVTGKIIRFVFEKKLDVDIQGGIRLNMHYNGQFYEGRTAGMDFESIGPEKL